MRIFCKAVNMRVSVVLILFGLSQSQFIKADDHLAVDDVEAGLSRLQTKAHDESSDILADQATTQSDVWAELRHLRDTVVRQLQDTVVENKVKFEIQVDKLRDTELEQKVKFQSQINELKKENAALGGRLALTELKMKALMEEKTNSSKVAFSFGTGKSGSYGPLSTDTILVLTREITNIGNAFSPVTGVFTAPIKGVYYFRYTMSGHSHTHYTTVRLMKNQHSVVVATNYPKGNHDYASSGATLLLEKGDLVYLRLVANSNIWDNGDNHFSFSGFLLFPM